MSSELLYAGDLVAMSDTIKDLRKKFRKWKKTFEIKGLKLNSVKPEALQNMGCLQVAYQCGI